MTGLFKTVLLALFLCTLAACKNEASKEVRRPMDPWAFRSVLDKKPRMLTLALDSAFYVSYNLANSTLYKVWKGGVILEGTVYTDKKNVQPGSWGQSYFLDSLDQTRWEVQRNNKKEPFQTINSGYVLLDNKITLKYTLVLSKSDSIHVEEQPEFIRNKNGNPGLERIFKTTEVPKNTTVSLISPDTVLVLKPNSTTRLASIYRELPPQYPPDLQAAYDHLGRYWMENSDCFTCHEMDRDNVGPSFRDIAARYPDDKNAVEQLTKKIREGGTGSWGSAVMNAHPNLAESEIKTMLSYIFSLNPAEKKTVQKVSVIKKAPENKETPKPGFGAPLVGVHPSYDLQTLHSDSFQPRVGGLAFLPDGGLLVTTWDAVGGVYLLEGLENKDTSKITVKRIASGLAEPLGIEVVDGEIYVLQKHELTRLIDLDGDGVMDEYRAVCNSWGVTEDFHEFAFGLVYKEGYFYVTLSMAMRLMEGERQHPDRGRTIRIGKDGKYESLNYGLRTPNGIGLGPNDDIFVTDNQGQWLPANKLIHVKKGEYHGMAWGLPDSLDAATPMIPPAIWLPDGEIGNSPSEPVLMKDVPYKGQLLHGDVTHGGIKRDFLEKIDGAYQGAVFRFSQGFEAGVNRLVWGPDGQLYAGGVGMVGGWSWKEKKFGLQRMRYNGKPTFEMLALRAKPKGFEIEFTESLAPEEENKLKNSRIQQWWYLPTESYGGPKMDLTDLAVSRLEVSEDRKKIYLEIPGLKKEHVVYFRLPDDLKSTGGQGLWSSEAWYTLNNIPPH